MGRERETEGRDEGGREGRKEGGRGGREGRKEGRKALEQKLMYSLHLVCLSHPSLPPVLPPSS